MPTHAIRSIRLKHVLLVYLDPPCLKPRFDFFPLVLVSLTGLPPLTIQEPNWDDFWILTVSSQVRKTIETLEGKAAPLHE